MYNNETAVLDNREIELLRHKYKSDNCYEIEYDGTSGKLYYFEDWEELPDKLLNLEFEEYVPFNKPIPYYKRMVIPAFMLAWFMVFGIFWIEIINIFQVN